MFGLASAVSRANKWSSTPSGTQIVGLDKSEREDLQVVDVTRTEFLATLRSQLSEVILHKYVADWQDATSELVIEMQKPGHAVCGLDFAMNHTCVPKDELKHVSSRLVHRPL